MSKLHGLPARVGDAQREEEVGPAHHTETDASLVERLLSDGGQGVRVRLDDVVEEVDGVVRGDGQRVPVEPIVMHERGKVQVAERAHTERRAVLLATWVGRAYLLQCLYSLC